MAKWSMIINGKCTNWARNGGISGWDTFEGNEFNSWIKVKTKHIATVRIVEATIIHDWKSKKLLKQIFIVL